jgi:hypothetical protein
MQKIPVVDPKWILQIRCPMAQVDRPWITREGGVATLPNSPVQANLESGSGLAHMEHHADLGSGSSVNSRSAPQPVPQRPRTRLQNNISKPKSFGDNFVCLMTVTGEPRDYDEAVVQQEWRSAMEEQDLESCS